VLPKWEDLLRSADLGREQMCIEMRRLGAFQDGTPSARSSELGNSMSLSCGLFCAFVG